LLCIFKLKKCQGIFNQTDCDCENELSSEKNSMRFMKTFLTAIFILSQMASNAQVAGQPDSLKTDSKEFVRVDEEASYPGGAPAWIGFLQKNLQADIPTNNNAPIGKYQAFAVFIVDKDGSVSDVKASTHFGFGMEEELIRVIKLSGKWLPAMSNGKPLKAYRRQPVTFMLDSEEFHVVTNEPYTLFANIDNEISVSAYKVKAADIDIHVQGGKVTRLSDGKFNVRVTKPGRINIEVVNSKKNDKEIGVASFEVIAK
jgi:hypothetical protein